MKYALPFIMLLVLVSCKKNEHEPVAGLQTISSLSQINTETSQGVSLIFFHASWCTICHQQRPAVSEIAQDADVSNVYFGEVEYDDHQDIVDAYNVAGFPTIVILKDGTEEQRLTGSSNTAAQMKTILQGLM